MSKKFGSESELNARLRQLTADLRELREELRGSLREKPHSAKKSMDEYFRKVRSRSQPGHVIE